MSAGIEPLKTCIRIWWKDKEGNRYRETLHDMPPTPKNITHAQEIAQAINMQLKIGKFDRDAMFPNSPRRKASYFDYYIAQWESKEQTLVANSSWETYKSKVDNHITQYWGKKQIAKIDVDAVETWVYKVLIGQKGLSSKTIKDILGHWRKIYSYWSRHQPASNDPSQYIKLNYNDPDDIHPFNKSEISLIIASETDPTLKNLWTVMLWSGLSSHELLPLAVSDIDFDKSYIYVQRGYVKKQYRVTKNRRRKRQVEILPIVREALYNQTQIVADNAPQIISITERDHRTAKQHELKFLWINKATNTHYTYEQLQSRWADHLQQTGVKYRSLNNGRHTYASQVLSTGVVTAEWLAKQLGHTNTDMIHKHYGKFIPEDSGHIIKILNTALSK